jgi:hypothetical protein
MRLLAIRGVGWTAWPLSAYHQAPNTWGTDLQGDHLALFSRRVLQQLIDLNARFLSEGQVNAHVAGLNRGGQQAIALEWEVAILAALSTLGVVRYEPTDIGSCLPDVEFALLGDPRATFVADITTLSDTGRVDENPVPELRDLILDEARRAQVSGNRFFLRIGGSEEGKRKARVVKLSLPPKGTARALIGRRFRSFFQQCTASPFECHRLHIAEQGIDVELDFDPDRAFFGMTHLAFRSARSLTRNPIYNRLHSKAKQLAGVSSPKAKGLILCAADTQLDEARRGSALGVSAIINRFLCQHSSVDFVLVLASVGVWSSFDQRRACIYSRLYSSRTGRPHLGKRALRVLQRVHRRLPKPVRSGESALALWRRSKSRLSYPFTERQMTKRSVRLSARLLLELLAGKITHSQFIERLHLGSSTSNVFHQWMDEGRLLVDAEIDSAPGEDDDWATLTVGAPDPSASLFRASPQPSDS